MSVKYWQDGQPFPTTYDNFGEFTYWNDGMPYTDLNYAPASPNFIAKLKTRGFFLELQ
jgi:hypothetical protein